MASVISGLGLVPVLFSGILGYALIFAPLVMSLFIGFRGHTMTESEIKLWYFAFAAVMGSQPFVDHSPVYHSFYSQRPDWYHGDRLVL
jgi:hypothetical protein